MIFLFPKMKKTRELLPKIKNKKIANSFDLK